MPRSALAISLLYALALAAASAAAGAAEHPLPHGEISVAAGEHPAELARAATGLEVLRHLGERVGETRAPAPATAHLRAGLPANRTRAGHHLPVGRDVGPGLATRPDEHLPYYPTAPPLA